jgi:hypothetical protein
MLCSSDPQCVLMSLQEVDSEISLTGSSRGF